MWIGIWRALRKSLVEFPALMYALISLGGENPQNPSIKCQNQLNLNLQMTFLKQQIFLKAEPTILG